MKKTVLRAYARLIAEVGARVQKGQDVVIEAELDQPEFVTMVADACYHAGARKVTVTWKHQALEKLAIRRESVKTLQTVEAWERTKLQHYVDTLPCRIYLLSEDPDGLRGVSPAKMARARQGRYSVIKPYRDQMEGRYQWCIAAVPGAAWAKKVFPNETKARAVEKLWEAILHTCRVDDDPIAAWNAHNADLQARCDHLNSLGIASLEYHASNGTNLTVGMIPEAQFCGGGEYTIGGSYFNPNLPTEECFISPKRGEAEGIVYSSKPLSYQASSSRISPSASSTAAPSRRTRARMRPCCKSSSPWTKALPTSASARSCRMTAPSTRQASCFTTPCLTKMPAATSRSAWASSTPSATTRTARSRRCARSA